MGGNTANLVSFEFGDVSFQKLVREELHRARTKFSRPQVGFHEGYGVLLEEVEEFWEEVKAQDHDASKLLAELVQIAAMAQRTAEDVIRNR